MNTDKRLFDYIFEQAKERPLDQAFGHQPQKGVPWTYYSSQQMVDKINDLSRGLLHLGLRPGDRVGTVVYKTTQEWVALDYAMLRLGIIGVPMYPTISAREYEYIIKEAGVQYCFVGEGDLFDKVNTAKAQSPSLRTIYSFVEHPIAPLWDSIVPTTDATTQEDMDDEIERISKTIRPDDVATFIYTSGTTGNPKGVVLTHRNIVFNVETMRILIPIKAGMRALSFLPVSHIFERAVLYAYTAYGASVSFTTPDRLGGDGGDIKGIKPHFFSAVPRLLEKVYEKIVNKGMEAKGIKRSIFTWAMELADQWDFDQKPSGFAAIKWSIADKLVFSKWRAALGGNLVGIITGASACPVVVMRAFNAAGILVREGYGMTEGAPAFTFNRFEPGGAMMGSVGQIVDGVELRIEEAPDFRPGEGEILVKGPNIMDGYYLQPEKTEEVIKYIDGGRWLCTGDVGMLVKAPNGNTFLKITDRKKELLKTSGGKYVAPAPIESMLREHRLVDQAMIVGDNLKFVSALIVPAEEGLRDWCEKNQIGWTSLPEVIKHPKVLERYNMLIERINPTFSHAEQVKKFALLPNTWEAVRTDGTVAELTPSMKIKRRVILEKFKAEIDGMYA
jgi:long-chain acyl-CoA synthetase